MEEPEHRGDQRNEDRADNCMNEKNDVISFAIECFHSDTVDPNTLLPIVKLTARGRSGDVVTIYALLDSGSTHSFVTVSALSKLDNILVQKDVEILVKQLGGTRTQNTQQKGIYLKPKKGGEIFLHAYVVPELMTVPEYSLPQGYSNPRLNDVFPRPPTTIDMIIGSQQFWKVATGHVTRVNDSLVLMGTRWGNVPSGTINAGLDQEVIPDPDIATERRSMTHSVAPHVYMSGTEQLSRTMEKMWKLEEFPLDHVGGSMSRDEVLAVQKVDELLTFNQERGRFRTGLLFREDPHLLNNFHAAKARLESLLRKLRKDPELKAAYTASMQEFFDLEVAEEVFDPDPANPTRRDVYYLPHRAVYDPTRISSKCRPVFDASCKTATGKSLNQCLLAGPPLQLSILSIEIRFRLRPVAVVGDISRMFLNVDVREQDRQYLRFLWKNPDAVNDPPRVFQFKSLIFGATDSPFHAITCLKRLVQEARKNPDMDEDTKWACHILENDTYVDDLTTGGSSTEEVLQRLEALTLLLGRAHFFIKKWASNSSEVLEVLPKECCGPTEIVDLGKGYMEEISSTISTLGVRWAPKEDVLLFDQFGELRSENEDTKTSVASLLAKIFDPLGLVSPFTLLARKVMKETFKDKLGWKDKLTGETLRNWHEWVEETRSLSSLKFPRFVPFKEGSEFHIFGDGATSCGYGAAVYVRTFLEEEERFVSNLLMAKARIAPMKDIGVPKLELKACLLVAEIAQQLLSDLDIRPDQLHCYSDNEVSLWWLTKNPSLLIPFVANRVEKIQKWGHKFSYVNTAENPADIASRGACVATLATDLWLHGPPFLSKPRKLWPKQKIDWHSRDFTEAATEGIKKSQIFSYQTAVIPLTVCNKSNSDLCPLHEYQANSRVTIGATANCLKFIELLRRRIHGENDLLGKDIRVGKHIEQAKIFWVHLVQISVFAADFLALEGGKKNLKSVRLTALGPFIDTENPQNLPVLRVGGRLSRSNLTKDAKHPLILPKSHPFTKGLIWGAHVDNLHAGVDWIHFKLRQEYWILSSRQSIRTMVRNCPTCRRLNATRGQQKMADLPSVRVNPEPAFSHTGVDYTGEVQLRKSPNGKATEVGYIAVFTCLSTRAVHLEVVETNSTYHFLMAFKRFLNTRGMPVCMYSDNAKQFKRAQLEIQETLEAANQELKQQADKYRFDWKYSTELAPHTAGVWESMVKGIKTPLRRVVKNALLTYTELTTVVKELEGFMNDRPLQGMSEDSMEVITPSMLVLGRKIRPWTDKFASTNLNQTADIRARWKYRNTISQQFWRAWTKEYRLQLTQRAKWETPHPNVRVNDIVLIEKDNIKKGSWPVARVVKVVKGRDGLVRSLHLTTGSVIDGEDEDGNPVWRPGPVYTRSIHGVFPLESAIDREHREKGKQQRSNDGEVNSEPNSLAPSGDGQEGEGEI